MSWGVGFIGAGAVVQSIHLPTLAHLSGDLHVAAVMDTDPTVAAEVAGRVQARATTSVDDLLADPAVDIVAVCSPAGVHADHVAAAVAAGKAAVLCEKPFVVDAFEADRMEALLAASTVPVVVGAMHTFDPAWTAVRDRFAAGAGESGPARLIRSTIMLPPNSRYEDFAAEPLARDHAADAAFLASPEPEEPVADCLLGLAVHDLPLIRAAVPTVEWVDSAIALAPYGYAIAFGNTTTSVSLTALFHAQAAPEWTLERWGEDDAMTITFTPSYVHAGSGIAEIRTGRDRTTVGPFPRNGYVEQWAHVVELAAGQQQDPAERRAIVDDIRFVLDLAGRATAAGDGSRP